MPENEINGATHLETTSQQIPTVKHGLASSDKYSQPPLATKSGVPRRVKLFFTIHRRGRENCASGRLQIIVPALVLVAERLHHALHRGDANVMCGVFRAPTGELVFRMASK